MMRRVPSSSAAAVRQLEDLSSPVGAFIRDCCVIGPGYEVPVADMWTAWKSWCEDNGRKPGTKQVFGRDLRAAVPGLDDSRLREGDTRYRVYRGITLRTRT